MVFRVAGMIAKLIGMSTTKIAANDTRCVATVENGASCRGKRTFLIRFALSSSDRDDPARAPEKKTQIARPDNR